MKKILVSKPLYEAPACEAVELLAARILCLSQGAELQNYSESDISDLF